VVVPKYPSRWKSVVDQRNTLEEDFKALFSEATPDEIGNACALVCSESLVGYLLECVQNGFCHRSSLLGLFGDGGKSETCLEVEPLRQALERGEKVFGVQPVCRGCWVVVENMRKHCGGEQMVLPGELRGKSVVGGLQRLRELEKAAVAGRVAGAAGSLGNSSSNNNNRRKFNPF
jgi:hypothetical protein